jgi:hypothetical protein
MRVKAGMCKPSQGLLTVDGCRGCTPEEAERIWRAAAEAIAQRDDEE